MLDLPSPPKNHHRLSPWLTAVFNDIFGDKNQLQLRARLRGNHVHILCETRHPPEKAPLVAALQRVLGENPQGRSLLATDPHITIHRLVIYGRQQGQKSQNWVTSLAVPSATDPAPTATPLDSSLDDFHWLVSHESLAQSGAPEAIARYLSDQFQTLGVAIRVTAHETRSGKPRLWVCCTHDYELDLTILGEPLAQKLRALALEQYSDGVIYFTVTGEPQPEWRLWVDLTPPRQMLREWASWGDREAISHILNQELHQHHLECQTFIREQVLYVFCNTLDAMVVPKPDPSVGSLIHGLLLDLLPQGLWSVTVYGLEQRYQNDGDPEHPIWVKCFDLPAKQSPELAPIAWDLARQGHREALIFILQRVVNKDLPAWLSTGGIRIKVFPQGRLLHVMAEAVICPQVWDLVPALQRIFQDLQLPNLKGIRIYGRRSGEPKPDWHHAHDLTPTARERETVEAEWSAIAQAQPYRVPQPQALAQALNTETLHSFLEEQQDLPEAFPEIKPLGQISSVGEFFRELGQGWQTLLVFSRIFVRQNSLGLTPGPSFQAIAVWGLVGSLMTLQVDWSVGQWLKHQERAAVEAELLASDLNQALELPEDIHLPQLSLQKSAMATDSFNEGLFTKESDRQVIFETQLEETGALSREELLAQLSDTKAQTPSFNNRLLDEKLALYQLRVAQFGPPDVLIVGSSRALRGIDPQMLQKALISEGYPAFDIFNFGVNGATVQVVNFILQSVIPPEQLPAMVIFADGARAFNSGRSDLTFEAIARSNGYQQLNNGTFPYVHRLADSPQTTGVSPWQRLALGDLQQLTTDIDHLLRDNLTQWSATAPRRNQLKETTRDLFVQGFYPGDRLSEMSPPVMLSVDDENIDLDGFLALNRQFNPEEYYRNHPAVSGLYDSDYSGFQLQGEQHQAFVQLTRHLKNQRVALVMVNQPLTDQYLDSARQEYETKFRIYLQTMAETYGIPFRDFVTNPQWQRDYGLFSDPSHLNRLGASRVALQLAKDPMIPWGRLR